MTKNYEDDGRAAEHAKIKNICALSSKYDLLTAEKEKILLIQAHCGDPELQYKATEELVLRNLRLVIKKAKEFMGKGIPLEDLVQEGITGIIRAIEKFEVDKGCRFSTYATVWCEQRVRRCIENKSRVVKIPLNVLSKITALKKIYKKLSEDLNRPPSSEEIAALLNITEEEAKELGRFTFDAVSLNSEDEDSPLSMIDYLVDHKPPLDLELENKEDKSYVHAILGMLTKEESNFIKLLYGFMDSKERTYREMSQLLKITIKEVKEKEQNILIKLRSMAEYDSINFES